MKYLKNCVAGKAEEKPDESDTGESGSVYGFSVLWMNLYAVLATVLMSVIVC